MNPAQLQLEEEIKRLHQEGSLKRAFEVALRGYTPWLKTWLLHRLGEEQRAKDVFQEISLKLWRGLTGFRWESRFKTWLCSIAIRELQRTPSYKEELPLEGEISAPSQVSSLATRLDKRSQLTRLFSQLNEEEQRLLLLRQLESDASWEELSASLHPEQRMNPEERRKEAARLRQRFSRLMSRLEEAAKDEPSLEAWLKELL